MRPAVLVAMLIWPSSQVWCLKWDLFALCAAALHSPRYHVPLQSESLPSSWSYMQLPSSVHMSLLTRVGEQSLQQCSCQEHGSRRATRPHSIFYFGHSSIEGFGISHHM